MNDPVDIMARTIWGEARGEGYAAMTAVALVIKNRAANPRWWGQDIVGVCKAPKQFSCWNGDDPNRLACALVDKLDPVFRDALEIADHVVNGKVFDITNHADSYYANYIREPAWAMYRQPVAIIGSHRFYKLEL